MKNFIGNTRNTKFTGKLNHKIKICEKFIHIEGILGETTQKEVELIEKKYLQPL